MTVKKGEGWAFYCGRMLNYLLFFMIAQRKNVYYLEPILETQNKKRQELSP